MTDKYRSALSKAKNLGSAKSGKHHWLQQRFTAVALVLATIWLWCFTKQVATSGVSEMIELFKNPLNIVMLIFFSSVGLYHGALGLQAIIEDYIHCRIAKITILVILQLFCLITIISFIIAILHLMNL